MDERIQTTANRVAAIGFHLWYFSMLASILYRLVILKQHPREFWDIAAIFLISSFFMFIACAKTGVLNYSFKKTWLPIGIGAFIGALTVQFIRGRIHSVVDVVWMLLGFPLGLGLVIGIAHFLNRRWERKEGIEDEK